MAMNNVKKATGKFTMKPGSKELDSPMPFRMDSPMKQLGFQPTGMGGESPMMATGPKLEKCHSADAACMKRNREARKKHAQSKPAKYRPSEVGGTDAKNSGGKSYSPKKGAPVVKKATRKGASKAELKKDYATTKERQRDKGHGTRYIAAKDRGVSGSGARYADGISVAREGKASKIKKKGTIKGSGPKAATYIRKGKGGKLMGTNRKAVKTVNAIKKRK